MSAIAEHNNRGLGLLEQFQYAEAANAFEKVVELRPVGCCCINLYLPVQHEHRETSEKAYKTFDQVLEKSSSDPHAHFRPHHPSPAGEIESVMVADRAVLQHDPADAPTWFWLGTTEDPSSKKAADAYRKAIEQDPSLSAAVYALGLALRGEDPAKSKEMLDRHKLLTESGSETQAKLAYGKMGKYGEAIGSRSETRHEASIPLPAFAPSDPTDITLALATRWAVDADFGEGADAKLIRAVRKRFGGTMVVLDFDQDGKSDLFLTGAVVEGSKVRNLLLRNLGNGKFIDATADAGLSATPNALGCCVGDFDNDGYPDLLLTTPQGVRLLRHRGKDAEKTGYDDVTQSAGLSDLVGGCLGAAWIDLDADGDLDLVVVPFAPTGELAIDRFAGKQAQPLGLAVYLNVGKSAAGPVGAVQRLSAEFRRSDQTKELTALDGAPLHIAFGDFNGDRSPDLVVLQDGKAPKHFANDRLLRFRSAPVPEKSLPHAPWNAALVLDSDNRERSDLLLLAADRPPALLRSIGAGQTASFESGIANSPSLLQATVVDVDLDGWADVCGITPGGDVAFLHNQHGSLLTTPSLLAPLAGKAKDIQAIAALDADGDMVPDLAVWSKSSGLSILRNVGNGCNGIAVRLTGRREQKEKLRCNADASGARMTVHAGTLASSIERSTVCAGLGQSSQPAILGIGRRKVADVLRIRWPDGTWQAELSVPANQVARISQTDRTPDSCPLLFAWDGEKFGFVADFLGGGTIGEYLPDGTCRQPRPEESVKIESHQLKPKHGKLTLKLTEPMDEVTYLDRVLLLAVDHPADMHVYPEERMSEAAPSQDLHAFRKIIRPMKATDHRGKDVLPSLLKRDRNYVDDFARLSWLGYAEEHHIDLDFGGAFRKFAAGDRVFLCLYGWTDYAYPEAVWAATQAGVPLIPPVLEEQIEGKWRKVEVDMGFPAGRPRMTLVEITGKCLGSGPLRIRSNMQVFWDEIFIAVSEGTIAAKNLEKPGQTKSDRFRVTTLAPSHAELRAGGNSAEYSPDGKQPTIYSDAPALPAPVTRLQGRTTRFGPVKELLENLDDRFVIFGPGSEVIVDFDATKLPPLPDGWSRSFVFRSWGYCKGASVFTATGGSVEPLPFRKMSQFPYGVTERHPSEIEATDLPKPQ
ncbi:MAG: FG-GAP-like repeat-containing protein [Gemmataceae bacterium]